MSWKPLGQTAPIELVDARLQLHHAIQIVASAGITFLEPQPDDSHPNLGWVESLGALVGRDLPEKDVQVGLRLADPALLIVDKHERVREEFALNGRTLEDGYSWLTAMTDPAGGLIRAAYEIPHHAIGQGAAFSALPGAAFAELGRWFANAQDLLSDLAERTAGASPLRCWPHHFDLGMLVVVASEPDGSLAKSIGIGLSPGDESYAEPYMYVSPWPYPEPSALPALNGGGRWHTEGHTSVILTGSELVAGALNQQRDRLDTFLNAAVDAGQLALSDPQRDRG